MKPGARKISAATPAVLLALLVAAFALGGPGVARDPLAAELDRWSAILGSRPASDPLWAQAREGGQPVLVGAREDLRQGRRLLALQRFAAARVSLAAALYVVERPAEQRRDMAAFDAEWTRMGSVLRGDLGPPSPASLAGLPAAVRGLAEAALLQVRGYYQASLAYGHNTTPEAGLYYLGTAQAQRDLVAFLRTLAAPSPRPAPALRPLRTELDALEAELLAAYRPPASVERHREFILASSTLEEARELDAAGLRYGAMLRYLQAAQRVAPLRPAAPAPAADALAGRLRQLAARLSSGGVDHSLGRMFLEAAQADAAEAAAPPTVAAIADDVLPRYFAALAPAPARPPAPPPAPRVTVTLVRWPYT